MSVISPIIHEAITLSPDPTEFMPVEVNSAFPEGAASALTTEEKTTIDRLIEAVPDKNDTMAINYWVDMGDKKVYLEGWIDKCLAGTGFPPMEGGEWDSKIEYMVRVTHRTLIEKQEEKNRPIGLYPGHLTLIEGGFREFEAGDRRWLYGVTWGVYEKIKEGNPTDNGKCYEDAWRHVIKGEEGELVHGSVKSPAQDKRINHAWVELPTGYVWEPQTGRYFTQEVFYSTYAPIVEYRYTSEEAAIMLARVGTHGPWTDEERARWLKSNPGEVRNMEISREEWQEAEGMWQVAKEDAERGDVGGVYLWGLLNKYYPENREKQIRLMGFMGEVSRKYRGRIPREEARDLARKWDVESMLTKELLAFLPRSSNPGNPARGGVTQVYVQELPKCDFCGKPALYDFRTKMGPWAYGCEEHFKQYGVGLGTGKGQRLIPRKALGEAEKIRGEPEKELSVTMTEKDLEAAVLEDIWYPVCPYCGAATPAEPDAHAVYCQACNRRFKIINPFFSAGEWTRLGYTPRQERQLQFLERMEPHERLGYPPTYWVDCRTCKVGKEFHSVEGARSFIQNHKGHDTWLKYGGTVDSLKLGSSSNLGGGAMDEREGLRAQEERLKRGEELLARGREHLARGREILGPKEKAIAEEAAVKAVELTGSKITMEVAREMSGEMLHGSPVSPHCERVLETPPKCYDFRGIRSYVLCRAWDIMEKEKRIRLPVGEAWAEARGVCIRE